MNTKIISIEEVDFLVPESYEPPFCQLSEFPDSCGSGHGIGQLIVPEHFYGLRVSPVCHIHDASWDVAEPSWNDFHESNYMFIRNLLRIIDVKSKVNVLKMLRNYRATTYFNMVDTVGAKLFWLCKRKAK